MCIRVLRFKTKEFPGSRLTSTVSVEGPDEPGGRGHISEYGQQGGAVRQTRVALVAHVAQDAIHRHVVRAEKNGQCSTVGFSLPSQVAFSWVRGLGPTDPLGVKTHSCLACTHPWMQGSAPTKISDSLEMCAEIWCRLSANQQFSVYVQTPTARSVTQL